MGQGAQFIHLVNEDSLRPSLFIFKSAISMIELEDVPPVTSPKKKLTRRESSIKANEQRKQQEDLKRVMRRKKDIDYN